MDFARKQLQKYGWSDGKGLGKNENGISEALRPKIKRSVTGIGHDPAADFTEHWWSALYNKAANNVEIEEKNGKTKKLIAKAADFQITNNSYLLKKNSNKNSTDGEYAEFFIKTAVLDGVKVENVDDRVGSEEDEDMASYTGGKEKKDVLKMTDEELFAACEGRTAHKGARHGLKALGKLARIEKQEQLLLEQPQYNGYSHAEQLKKKRKNKCDENTNVYEDDEKVSSGDTMVNIKKKKRNKIDETINKFDEIEKANCNDNESTVKTKKKKGSKSDKYNKSDEDETKNVFDEGEEANSYESTVKNKKKKNKSNKTDDESLTSCKTENEVDQSMETGEDETRNEWDEIEEPNSDESIVKTKKKKNKSYNKNNEAEINSCNIENELDESIEANSQESKVKKKKGKNNDDDTSRSCKNESEETGMMKHKKLKKKGVQNANIRTEDEQVIESVNVCDETAVAYKKKKKRIHCFDNSQEFFNSKSETKYSIDGEIVSKNQDIEMIDEEKTKKSRKKKERL